MGILKGNYNIKNTAKLEKAEKSKEASLEEAFEGKTMEKLGGSIAFVKKSSKFVWKGK